MVSTSNQVLEHFEVQVVDCSSFGFFSSHPPARCPTLGATILAGLWEFQLGRSRRQRG